MKKLWVILVFVILSACAPEAQTIEVTKLVEVTVEVEVTKVVEIPVTVVVTSTSLPAGIWGSVECDDYTDKTGRLLEQWDAAFEVAMATQRINLSDRIVEMQDIRLQVLDLKEPECAAPLGVQDKFISMMDDGIDLFIDFMAEESIAFTSAIYIVNKDVANDAFASLVSQSDILPNRVHYFVYGDTDFAVEYMDETGQLNRVLGELGKVDQEEFPVVYTAILAEDQVATVHLFSPASTTREMNCIILVNGIEAVSQSGFRELTCELTE